MALDTRTPQQPQEQVTPASIPVRSPATLPMYTPPAYHHTYWRLRIPLVALEAFVALTAIYGALFVVPAIPQEWLHAGLIAPFADATIPALALGILCGGGSLIALISVLAWPTIGAITSVVAGAAMIIFELVEMLVVGFTAVMYPTQPVAWLQVIYIVVGAAIALLGARLWKAETGSYRFTRQAFQHGAATAT
ncbi:MAG: hypothetical protein ACXWQ5_22675 [Ktedonobacterales bacterium]